ncbi:MAG: damage-control phosphatase ARMT1 family protein [Desulfonatronovibrionaceae bacterium]
MHTRLDCLPCFLRQALHGARLTSPNDTKAQEKILRRAAEMISEMDTRHPPPLLAGRMYADIAETSGTSDLFHQYKQKCNREALALLPELERRLDREEDRLFFALRVSIVGNYMDAGVAREYDWRGALEQEEDSCWAELHYNQFQRHLAEASKVLILGDNCGEIALDTLLAKELVRQGHAVTYAVRGQPILNDATLEDARQVDMFGICRVMPSGSDCPGTVLSRCTEEFKSELCSSDIVISKGQGNFEALGEEKSGIYFAFKVKCEVVADLVGLPIGSSVFRRI